MLGSSQAKFVATVDALREGDQRAYMQQLKHLSNVYDTRETNQNSQIFNGFYLIHYACYFKQTRALELLLPTYYNAATRSELLMDAPYVSETAKLILGEHTNALFICLMVDYLEGAKMIISFFRGKGKLFDGTSHYGQTVLHYAAVHHNITSTYLLYERYLMNQWDAEDQFPEHFTFVALLAYAGRNDVMTQMLTLLQAGISIYADRIAAAMLFVDGDDCNMVYICEKPIEEIEKYCTDLDYRCICQRTVKRAVVIACKYIKQRRSRELDVLLEAWLNSVTLRRYLSYYIRDLKPHKVSRIQLFDAFIDSSIDSSFSYQ